jgi:hypothetical protein
LVVFALKYVKTMYFIRSQEETARGIKATVRKAVKALLRESPSNRGQEQGTVAPATNGTSQGRLFSPPSFSF